MKIWNGNVIMATLCMVIKNWSDNVHVLPGWSHEFIYLAYIYNLMLY